jgi:hypothetical protein
MSWSPTTLACPVQKIWQLLLSLLEFFLALLHGGKTKNLRKRQGTAVVASNRITERIPGRGLFNYSEKARSFFV